MNTKKKRLIPALLAALALCLLPGAALAADETQMDVSKGSITIGATVTGKDSSGTLVSTDRNDNGYIITGESLNVGYTITVTNTTLATPPVKITLKNVYIGVGDENGKCALDIAPGASVILTLADGSMNTLMSGAHFAGVRVPETASLTIQGGGGLNAQGGVGGGNAGGGGAGIGGNGSASGQAETAGSITINSGTVWAQGGKCGAGIGGGGSEAYGKGGAGGLVTLNGGTVYARGGAAKFEDSPGGKGAAIGGGWGGLAVDTDIAGINGTRATGSTFDISGYGAAYEWSNNGLDKKPFATGRFTYNNAPGFLGIRPLPVIAPASGAYASPVTVSVTPVANVNPTSTNYVTYITYTVNGTKPNIITYDTSQSDPQLYNGPFSVIPTAAGVRVRVRTTELANGMAFISSVVEATYTLPSSGGPSVYYKGGSTFGASRSDAPTAVLINNTPVPFSANNGVITVSSMPAGASWVTIKWGSTSATTNFTPNGAVTAIANVELPKTGDASVLAMALCSLAAAAAAFKRR